MERKLFFLTAFCLIFPNLWGQEIIEANGVNYESGETIYICANSDSLTFHYIGTASLDTLIWELKANNLTDTLTASFGDTFTKAVGSPDTLILKTSLQSANVFTIDTFPIQRHLALQPGVIQAQDNQICHNSSTTLSFTTPPSGSDWNYQYEWFFKGANSTAWDSTAVGTNTTYNTGSLTENREYYVRVTSTGCSNDIATSGTILVDVAADLVVGSITYNNNTAQATICYGTTPAADFNVSASGGRTLTYSWERSLDGGANWSTRVSNQSASSFTDSDILTADSAQYRVVVSSTDGCGSETSGVYTLQIRDSLSPATLSIQAGSSATLCQGETTILERTNASGSSGNYTYTWQSSTDAISWTDFLVAATDLTDTTPNLHEDTWYRLITEDNVTCLEDSVVGAPVKVTVRDTLQSGVIIADDDSVCYNQGTTLRFAQGQAPSGSDGNYQYKWFFKGANSTAWDSTAVGTNTTYNTGSLTENREYYVRVTSTGCSNDIATSGTILVDVAADLVVGSFTYNNNTAQDTICYGTSPAADFNISANGGRTLDYTWERSLDGGANWSPRASNQSASSFTDSDILTADSAQYRVIVGSTDGCGSYTSGVYTLLIDPLPDTDSTQVVPRDQLCKRAQGLVFDVINLAATGTITNQYTWQLNGLSPYKYNSYTRQMIADIDNEINGELEVGLEVKDTSRTSKCFRSLSKENIVSLAPDSLDRAPLIKGNIQRKSENDSILLYTKNEANHISYRWGYIQFPSGRRTFMSNSNRRYYNFDTLLIDTNLLFFVQLSNDTCVTYTFWSKNSDIGIKDKVIRRLELFPNPNNGSFRIDADFDFESLNLQLFDSSGRRLPLEAHKDGIYCRINTKARAGLYYLKVKDRNGSSTIQVLIND